MEQYYDHSNFINASAAIDIALMEHFSNMLLKGNMKDVVYANNAYSFRKRSQSTGSSSLQLPFANFYKKDANSGRTDWWNAVLYSQGIYLPEISAKLQMVPVTLEYEASFWCHRQDDLEYAFHTIRMDSDNKTSLKPSISVEGVDIPFQVLLQYGPLGFDPKYEQNDWLEKGHLHSVGCNFSVDTFIFQSNKSICIPTSVEFNFAKKLGFEGSEAEVHEFVIDHLSGEVKPK